MSQKSLKDYKPAPRNPGPTQALTEFDFDRFGRIDGTVLRILSDNLPHTNHELGRATNGARINSSISRLRKKHGFRIETIKVGKDGTYTNRLLDVL